MAACEAQFKMSIPPYVAHWAQFQVQAHSHGRLGASHGSANSMAKGPASAVWPSRMVRSPPRLVCQVQLQQHYEHHGFIFSAARVHKLNSGMAALTPGCAIKVIGHCCHSEWVVCAGSANFQAAVSLGAVKAWAACN